MPVLAAIRTRSDSRVERGFDAVVARLCMAMRTRWRSCGLVWTGFFQPASRIVDLARVSFSERGQGCLEWRLTWRPEW